MKDKKLIFTFDATKKARFGVLPRFAKDDLLIKWFELPNCFIFHNGVQACFPTLYIQKRKAFYSNQTVDKINFVLTLFYD